MQNNKNIFELKTLRVIIFKDGYCLFVKKAIGTLDLNSKGIIDKIPESMVIGSFWIIPSNGTLLNIIAKQQIFTRKSLQEKEKYFELQFESKAAGTTIEANIIYFGPGIRWIPTYHIKINENNECNLRMQAELINEAEDLENVAIDLVVGVPNFRFKDSVSPLSFESILKNSLRETAPQLVGQQMFSNVMMDQRMGGMEERTPSTEDFTSTTPTIPSELGGEKSEDFFLYKVSKISVNVGERAIIPLISTKQEFKHIYTWDLHLSHSSINVQSKSSKSYISPVKLTKNEIWHQIEISNNTNVPWTTGPAIIIKDLLPLCQELLTYTSIGENLLIPLSIAVDIRGTYSEEEIEREINAIHFDDYDYNKVSKKGTLKIINYKKESVNLLIKCDLGGNAITASHDGKITISDFRSNDWASFKGSEALTGHSLVKWNIRIAPGENKELTCDYHYYIR